MAEDLQPLFAEYRRTQSEAVRNRIVERSDGLAHYFARRYRNRGVEPDDLLQVARLALVRAVERFDPDQGYKFATFAGRTIDGELKRYFRDRTWAVRVPRGLQERAVLVRAASDRLAASQGHAPTVGELAVETGLDPDEVLEALEASTSYSADSLDRPAGTDDGMVTVADRTGDDDVEMERAALRVAMDQLLETLDPRERTIVRLRFEERLTQSEIAAEVGVSQMHVSRLLRRSLETLRQHLHADS